MTLLRRRTGRPRARSIRPAERYLIAGADVARRLGHTCVGTEHVLGALVHDREGGAARLLVRLGVQPVGVERALARRLPGSCPPARIDPQALASLGIDLEAVRERVEHVFGPGALEATGSGCLGISPRLKLALAHALDHAAGTALSDAHVLLGMLSVPDSAAARVLADLGVTREAGRALLRT